MNPTEQRPRLQGLRRALEPLIRPLMHFYWRFSRGTTLGARAVVIDGQGRIFLIKHSYVDGLAPAGRRRGDRRDDAAGAGARARRGRQYPADGAPRLHGVFFNKRVSRRDHVALFVVRDFVQDAAPRPNREIIAHGFFAPDALPPDTGRGTRARIAEVLGGATVSEVW